MKDLPAIRVTEAQQLKHWFEDGPQATLSQTVRQLKEQQAIFEVLSIGLLACTATVKCIAMDGFACAALCGPIRWDIQQLEPGRQGFMAM